MGRSSRTGGARSTGPRRSRSRSGRAALARRLWAWVRRGARGRGGDRWNVELSWASGSRTGTLVLDDHGRPFRTTAYTRSRACAPVDDGGPLEPVPHPER